MSLLPRLLAPLTAAAILAAAASPAQADPVTTASFPGASVEITDSGSSSDTVHLIVTPADPADLESTHVFLGGNATTSPYTAIGVNGVRDARYADEADGELSTADCAIYNGSMVVDSAPVTVAGDGESYSADLPKGEVISFDSTGVAVGIAGDDPSCENEGFDGLDVDYLNTNQTIDGFSWADPAAPVVTAHAGRRQIALSFDQAIGTQYDIYRVGDDAPFAENIRGNGDDVQVVLTEGPDGQPLTPGTQYSFQVKATRLFHREDDSQPTSPLSAAATATTAAAQVLHFTATPASVTTNRSARFGWTIDANGAGEAPFCVLDATEYSGTEVPCTATGAAIDGLAAGAHTLKVYPSDGENAYSYSWTVNAVPAVAPIVSTPVVTKPAVKTDPDGDGIKNTWLVGGKPAAAPSTPKARLVGGNVKLKLGATLKKAKKIRVYRAVGKGAFKLVKTLSAKAKSFTDTKVKPGKTYTYKTVAVNAKGQQGKASKKATLKVGKRA